LVEKVPSQADRRTVSLSLSEAGELRLHALNTTLNDLADQAMEHIPSQEHPNIRRTLEWLQQALLDLTEEKQLPPGWDMEGAPSCTCV
jgi:DNA-binding MarR family transcriptional regulator